MASHEIIRERISAALRAWKHDLADETGLLDHIMRSLGDTDEAEYRGWRLVRKIGSDFPGTRGRVRDLYGWEATHIATGKVKQFKPDSSGDVQIGLVELMLDQQNEILEKLGRFLD